MSVRVPEDLYYYTGEKPPPLPCRYEDDDGVLITSIAGTVLAAKCSIDGAAETSVTCTNNDNGTFTIDWNTTTSDFTVAGSMKIDVLVTDSPREWYMNRFSIPVRER